MKLKEYAATITAVLVGIISFDVIWQATEMPVEHVMAYSMFLALAVGVLFMLFADREKKRMGEGWSCFEDTESGLNVMLQKSSGKGKRSC